ncbi:hypothetical protein C8R47DRAFT_1204435 [Mycena vitilis]|nr:hypothetical protein C8R47DRAFT_1204435 [Mycena vitilis]
MSSSTIFCVTTYIPHRFCASLIIILKPCSFIYLTHPTFYIRYIYIRYICHGQHHLNVSMHSGSGRLLLSLGILVRMRRLLLRFGYPDHAPHCAGKVMAFRPPPINTLGFRASRPPFWC